MTAANGEPDGQRIARWVCEHGRALHGYVLALVRRPEAADDVVQEVFRRAWIARDRYHEQGHERAYLLRIADRLVVDRSRRLGLEIHVDDATWKQVEPAINNPEPGDLLAAAETNTELAAALDCLTSTQKRVLLLRYFGDLTFEQIAETLGCPLSTALSHCRRGLIALRRLLPEEVR
jgi:RNA polymerase sigma-70 factor (ECF subfamily)